MKKILLVSVLLSSVLLTGCNTVTRNFGGTQTIDLEANTKLVNMTWKEDSLWVLTRAMKEGEKPEVYLFKEDSNFGVMNGTVIVNESK